MAKEYIEREAFVNVIDREIAQCHCSGRKLSLLSSEST